jgi:RimJ/RimL family protein N-acetyltransferase
MTDIPTLRTGRLTLRAPCEADFPMYAAFFVDAGASAFYGGPLGEVAAWSRLARDVGHWMLRGYGVWAVERIDTGEGVGVCGLYWPTGWPRPELTWWILPAHRRLGFAREASRAAIRFGHETLGWTQVETHCDDANAAALGLISSLGGTAIARETVPDSKTRDVFAFPCTPEHAS